MSMNGKQRARWLSDMISETQRYLAKAKEALEQRIDKKVEKIEDTDAIVVIRKQIKQRQDSIEQFKRGNREDLAANDYNLNIRRYADNAASRQTRMAAKQSNPARALDTRGHLGKMDDHVSLDWFQAHRKWEMSDSGRP